MSDELGKLRDVLRRAIKASRLGARQIEQAVGIGHGTLDRLLDGSLDLRVRHLLGFARILKVAPRDFLELGFPELESEAKYRLVDWITPREPAPPGKAPGKASAPAQDVVTQVREVVKEELAETIRAVVRQELEANRRKGS